MNTHMFHKPQLQLYTLFGMQEYATSLSLAGKTEELAALDKLLTDFIIAHAYEDLPEEAKQQLENIEIKDGAALYAFFNNTIPHFSEKLKSYGTEFRNTTT